jgi:tyrosinase
MARRFLRQNVYELGGEWADPVLWYARGVKVMKGRSFATSTSWLFYGAIHGIVEDAWRNVGLVDPADQAPDAGIQQLFWRQCQHGTWFFLPWHRGYLLAFEAVVREAVIEAGGPEDWALPYWNYFEDGQSALPPEFASEDWPDEGTNPLFTQFRNGPAGDGKVFVDTTRVNLDAMSVADFTGVDTGGDTGFGGVDTGGFAHGGSVHGRLESQPHDIVHVQVGGPRRNPGLMSIPDFAGLDPIFWLHHANIDRLWEVWRRNPPGTHVDPTETGWLDFPLDSTEQGFVLPLPVGTSMPVGTLTPDGTSWTFTPREVADMAALGYEYDDLSAAGPVAAVQDRRVKLGGTEARGAAEADVDEEVPVARDVELVGANDGSVEIGSSEVRTSVRLDTAARDKVSGSLARVADGGEPDRVFLNLQNVRSSVDGGVLDVYVGAPVGPGGEEQPERLAGSVGLFGVQRASLPDGDNAGAGLTIVLDISDIVDDLHLSDSLDVDTLSVRIVPEGAAPDDATISIGQVSIVREGR